MNFDEIHSTVGNSVTQSHLQSRPCSCIGLEIFSIRFPPLALMFSLLAPALSPILGSELPAEALLSRTHSFSAISHLDCPYALLKE